MILAPLHRVFAAGSLLLIAALALLLAQRTHERDLARATLARERAQHAAFVQRTRAAAAEAARIFTERARRAEQAQARISQEVSDDYATRLADLRRRYDALRLRPPRANDRGGAGQPRLPALPGAAGRADAPAGDPRLPPALTLDERFLATEQALRLEALQAWVRRQVEASSREADSTSVTPAHAGVQLPSREAGFPLTRE